MEDRTAIATGFARTNVTTSIEDPSLVLTSSATLCLARRILFGTARLRAIGTFGDEPEPFPVR